MTVSGLASLQIRRSGPIEPVRKMAALTLKSRRCVCWVRFDGTGKRDHDFA